MTEQRITQERREELELRYWRESETERPGAESIDMFLWKMFEAQTLLEKLKQYEALYADAKAILELGSGQGWGACLTARQFPNARIIATDISSEALESLPEWARVFKVEPPETMTCRSYEIPMDDESVDLVSVFASAHHFGRHRATFAEIHRVLRPGGKALYLHEPACRDYIYKRAVARKHRNRPAVDEDVLRYEHLAGLARDCGLEAEVRFAPTTTGRRPKETIYYFGLQRLPVLQRFLPCTADFVFTRPY